MWDYFLFNQPWRRLLLKVSDYLPVAWEERLLQALYPSDAVIQFADDTEEISR